MTANALNQPANDREVKSESVRSGNRKRRLMNIRILILSLLISPHIFSAEFDQIYIGKYSWGAEVDSFTNCDSKISYWASYNWAGIKMLEFYKQNSEKPYQPMYLVFRGHLLDEEVDGFAQDYDGIVHISEVKEFSFEIPASCQ